MIKTKLSKMILTTNMFSNLYKILFVILIVVSCSTPTGPPENDKTITLTGTIENKNGTTITTNMNVYVVWKVTSGTPDYDYVWGKGSIDKSNMTFKVTLQDKPPVEALNSNSFGVGIIAILDDSKLQNGIFPTDYPIEKTIGLAGWNCVFYKSDTRFDSTWVKRFSKGFSAGVGVEEDALFDTFKPTNKDSIKITIDALENIRVVNWT